MFQVAAAAPPFLVRRGPPAGPGARAALGDQWGYLPLSGRVGIMTAQVACYTRLGGNPHGRLPLVRWAGSADPCEGGRGSDPACTG